MTALSIQPTYPIFTDIDGQPLEDGFVWIGVANTQPIGNPINVYWDAALTLPAAQPIRTRGGYPVNSGTPARLYVDSDYSIRVMNKNGSVVYSAPAATERLSGVVVTGVNASDVSYTLNRTGALERSAESKFDDTISILDFIPEAEHAAIKAGTSTFDCTSAIQDAINTNAGLVYWPAGVYLCDPIQITNTDCSTMTWVGEGSGYNGTLGANSGNVATIRCRTAGTVFFEFDTVHRFQMRNIGLDGDGLCDIVYKLKQNCTYHTYDGCSFVNAKATTGIVVQLGDPVNSQVDWTTFNQCLWQNTKGARHSISVKTYGTNTINNTFYGCRFLGADTHVLFEAGSQTNVIENCDIQAYDTAAIRSAGNSSYTIRGNYTESSTGTYFFNEVSVVYIAGSGVLSTIENNLLNSANTLINVSADKAFVIRNNRMGSNINVQAPTSATQYYIGQIYNNQFASSVVDTGNTAAQWNNAIGGVGLGPDFGQLIAVGVGNMPGAAQTYRRAKKPIQLGATSVDSGFVSTNYDVTTGEAYAAGGYATAMSQGFASGYVRLNSSTTQAAAPGDVLTIKSVGFSGLNLSFEPSTNNEITLGRAGFRWSEVFAVNGTINTSDGREKQQIRTLLDAEKAVALKCKGLLRAFKWNEAVEKKGDAARIHFGIIAQELADAFRSEGLDPDAYGVFCYDEWDDHYEETYELVTELDDNGIEQQVYKVKDRVLVAAAGNAYGVRYEELLAFIIAAI
jgi:hypothetical protein